MAKDSDMDIPEDQVLGDDDLPNILQQISEDASTKAGQLLTLLKEKISHDVDLSSSDGRSQLSRAVKTARDIVEKKTNGEPFSLLVRHCWPSLRTDPAAVGIVTEN